MTADTDGLAIIIEGRREDWPGGTQILTPLPPRPREKPFRGAHWFGTRLDPGGNEVWFRITWEAIHRMQEETSRARGGRLVDALLNWMTPAHQLGSDLNSFQVRVSDDGDTWLEHHSD